MLKCEYKKTKKNELYTKIWHCDFEEALSAAIKECFPFSQIKYCFFHYGQILFRKINSVGENGLNINKEFHNSKDAKKLFLMLKY